jgi:hypothetical protein
MVLYSAKTARNSFLYGLFAPLLLDISASFETKRNDPMLTKTIVAALATIAVATLAAPAFASYDYAFDQPKIDSLNQYGFELTNALKAHGVNVVQADAWGNLIRAEVRTNDGRTVVRFFQQDTYQPVEMGHAVN